MLKNDYLNLPDNWEEIWEQMMLYRSDTPVRRGRVYICSPCRSDSTKGLTLNMKAARIYMFYTYGHFPGVPVAPHAYLPLLLSDRNEDERAFALSLGLRFLENCGEMFVCGDRLSYGMYGEIEEAVKRDIPILVFSWPVFQGVQAFFLKEGFSPKAARYDDSGAHLALSWGADKLAPYWEVERNGHA
jgi:hypothetical protein